MGIIKTLNRKIIKFINWSVETNNLNINNKNILITGSNSGIGLSLLKKLFIKNNILAIVNKNSSEVEKYIFDKKKIVKCDFVNSENILKFENKIINFQPNILINNAATFGEESANIENKDLNEFQRIININALSQFSLIQSCIKAKKLEIIVNISSQMGSITMNKDGGYYFYRTSKSLFNSISKNLSIDLKESKINVFCIHPGNVKTKLNTGGLIMPDTAAQKIINICSENHSKYSGLFINLNKKVLDW